MIYLHEIHEIVGGKKEKFSEAMRSQWKPLIERDGLAKVLWFFHHAVGTSVSYQAVSIAAIRDWQAWGTIVERFVNDPTWKKWNQDVCQYRKDVVARLLLPNPLSPLQEVDFDQVGVALDDDMPAIYLHDTGWPYPGKMEEYIEALHTVLEPQMAAVQPPVISIAATWRTCPGTGRFHEAIILSKIHNWELFSFVITLGEPTPQPGDWMMEGLKYRDTWESKILRTADWSPMK